MGATQLVALPPVSACLMIASNVVLAAAITNLWLGDQLDVRAHLPTEAAPWPILQVGLVFRLLVPFDVALISIVNDLVVANDVSAGVRPGFYYFAVAARCILWSIALTMASRLLGMSGGGGGMVTGWGVLGFGLTLSLQQTAKDLFSTLQLFLTRPYDVGDLIDAGQGHRGWVVTVGWRFTTVKLLSNAQHCAIPNVALADTRIQNFSRIQEGGRRGDIELRVALDTPVEVLRRIPGWLRSCATDAGLKVVWSLMTDVTTHGHNFKAIVTGPADAVEFDSCKQEALFALLEVLSEHSVALPSGNNASPVTLVKASPKAKS